MLIILNSAPPNIREKMKNNKIERASTWCHQSMHDTTCIIIEDMILYDFDMSLYNI